MKYIIIITLNLIFMTNKTYSQEEPISFEQPLNQDYFTLVDSLTEENSSYLLLQNFKRNQMILVKVKSVSNENNFITRNNYKQELSRRNTSKYKYSLSQFYKGRYDKITAKFEKLDGKKTISISYRYRNDKKKRNDQIYYSQIKNFKILDLNK